MSCDPSEEITPMNLLSGYSNPMRMAGRVLCHTAAAVMLCLPNFVLAAPEPGLESMLVFRRMQCSLQDEVPVVYSWNGRTYSRVRGEPDRTLFKVTGMNIRQCATVNDPERGVGFRMVSREILIYQDPLTGEVMDTWENPWSGETVDVLHVENDPVNQRPMFADDPDGKPFSMPFQISGDQWWVTSTIPLFYTNALGGDYQDYVGGKYQATEMFNFMGDVKDLDRDAPDSANFRVGWVRISDWLPWMKMRGREGILYFHTAGRKLENYDQLPDVMKEFIDTRYPKYREPPPMDDPRPNETSWTYFLKHMEAKAEAK
jgi:hypothetical protein